MKNISQLTSIKNPWTMRFPSLWDELPEFENFENQGSGLSVSEDEKSIYVEAALPGVDPAKIEITIENGVVRITGHSEEEKKDRKYYRKTTSSFEYTALLPADIDESVEPQAEGKDGLMKITFAKLPKAQPKKIRIKGTK